MSMNGEVYFVSDKFAGKDADANRLALLRLLRDKFGTYWFGNGSQSTNFMLYSDEETSLAHNAPRALRLSHDCRHVELIIRDGENNWALDVIEDLEAVRQIAEGFGATMYYASEYAKVYDEEDLASVIEQGELIEVTEDKIEEWRRKARR